jgi:hypothetical protein
MNFSFGSDPEFMLTKDGKCYSAIGILPSEGQFHYDNVLAECKIPPGRSKEEVLVYFRRCFRDFAKLVKPYKLTIQASQNYPLDQLQHKDALKAGCQDEHCPYTMKQILAPELRGTTQRTAGGHIHLGDEKLKYAYKVFPVGVWNAAKALDFFLGISSIYLDADSTTLERKKLFGKAGRYRKTNYGIEYRCLSNFWLASPKLVSIIYDLCGAALQFMQDEHSFWFHQESLLEDRLPSMSCTYKFDVEKFQKAINEHNEKLAYLFFNQIKMWIPDSTYKAIESGAYKHTYDFYKEWGL